jgi:hypothetical protein
MQDTIRLVVNRRKVVRVLLSENRKIGTLQSDERVIRVPVYVDDLLFEPPTLRGVSLFPPSRPPALSARDVMLEAYEPLEEGSARVETTLGDTGSPYPPNPVEG